MSSVPRTHRRQSSPAAPRLARRCRLRPAHRLRQRRQSASHAFDRAPQGIRCAFRSRRHANRSRRSTPDRKLDALVRRRRDRSRRRAMGRQLCFSPRFPNHSFSPCLIFAPLVSAFRCSPSSAYHAAHRAALRPRSRDHRGALFRQRHFERRNARRHQRQSRPLRGSLVVVEIAVTLDSPRRRQPHAAKPQRIAPPRSWLRSPQCPDLHRQLARQLLS